MEPRLRKVWLIADSVYSPLGTSGAINFDRVASGISGITHLPAGFLNDKPIYAAYCQNLNEAAGDTRFEALSKEALKELQKQISIPKEKTLFILSTTKGNIELLEKGEPTHKRIDLHAAGNYLAHFVGLPEAMVISNACTSGVVALIMAKRFIESGHCDNAVVLGADALTRFVISGFQSLNAMSAEICRPFDASRKGINLGEAASAIFLTAHPENFNAQYKVGLLGGAITNDANHISGPSKTGEELAAAVQQAMQEASVQPHQIDFISAHGTATVYNDEMESKAFNLVGLSTTPLHSLKGNFGHTLGAAGAVEAAMCIHSLRHKVLLPSLGFEELGVSQPLNIIRQRAQKNIQFALKTSSGFGGCNAAIILHLES